MATSRGLSERFEALPEWARWVLCWPVSFILSALLGWFFRISIGSVGPESLARIAHAALGQFAFLGAIYFTVPRAKLGFVVGFIALRTLLLAAFVIGTPLALFEIEVGIEFPPITWSEWWVPLLGEAVTLSTSLGLYRQLRNESRVSPHRP